MKLFEKMKEEIRRIETENPLERNFLRFVMNYMINVDERKRLSPKRALNLLSKLVKKFSGKEPSKQTIILIEEAKEGGLGEYLSKKEEIKIEIMEVAQAGGEEGLKEAGREETMRDILKKQTKQLDEEEKGVVEDIQKGDGKTQVKPKKKKRKKKKKKKRTFIERLSLMNLRKIQKKISKECYRLTNSQKKEGIWNVRDNACI